MSFELAFPKEATERFDRNRDNTFRDMRTIINNPNFRRELADFDDPTAIVVLGTITIRDDKNISSTVAGINVEGELIRIVTRASITKERGWVTIDADVYFDNDPEYYVDELERAVEGSPKRGITYNFADGDPAGEYCGVNDLLERSRWRVVNAEREYKRTCKKYLYEVYFMVKDVGYHRGIVVSDTENYLHESILTDIDPTYELKAWKQIGFVTEEDIGLYRVLMSMSRYPTPNTVDTLTEEEVEEVNVKGRTKGDSLTRSDFKILERPVEEKKHDITVGKRSISIKSNRSPKIKI